MKLFGKRLLFFLVPVLIFLSANILYNYWFDPYGVIKEDMQSQITEPNQHYLKTKFIIKHPDKFNAFLFGSSRTGKIDIRNIKDGNKWYNFSYSEALPEEILNDIKLLLKNKVKMKEILIGLDEISYLVAPEAHLSQTLRKPYINNIKPLYEYYLLPPSLEMYNAIRNIERSEFYTPGMYSDIYTTGCFLENKKDEYIEKDSVTHNSDEVFNRSVAHTNFHDRTVATIKEINEIISICKTNNIRVRFFINPLHINNYLSVDKDKYFNFLKQLAGLSYFYDFSGVNSITTNNYYYYETSHYRPIVGEKMIKSIFAYDTDSFGQRTSAENIDIVIDQKRKELSNYKSLNH